MAERRKTIVRISTYEQAQEIVDRLPKGEIKHRLNEAIIRDLTSKYIAGGTDFNGRYAFGDYGSWSTYIHFAHRLRDVAEKILASRPIKKSLEDEVKKPRQGELF